MAYSEQRPWGWCRLCKALVQSSQLDQLACPECGETLTPSSRMTQAQRDAAHMQEWIEKIVNEGLSGPSPGGAAGELACSRAHIDMLVEAGVLERSTYDHAGHKIILISQRSIERAKRNKKETGSWAPRGRHND